MTIRHHLGDLPDSYSPASVVAIDTETLGLNPHRDRLCVVQLSNGDGSADVVQVDPRRNKAPNLCRMLADPSVTKLFHFARFDLAVLFHNLGVMPAPVYCTKIASKLVRTYTDRHGLKDLLKELLNIDISKQQQSSDWAAEHLSEAQLAYAAGMFCTFTRSRSASILCWRVRAVRIWRQSVTGFCREGAAGPCWLAGDRYLRA